MTDGEIRALFDGASDFETRTLRSGTATLYAYYIDGLTSGSDISDYIFKPIVCNLPQDVQQAYEAALNGGVYIANAKPCKDLNDVALKLVNGFCVVLFPDAGALALKQGPELDGDRELRMWRIR